AALGVPAEKFFINVDRYGNTGATSVSIALAEMLERETILPGDNLLLTAFGGGLTWGAAVVRWADIPALRATDRVLRERPVLRHAPPGRGPWVSQKKVTGPPYPPPPRQPRRLARELAA